MSSDQYRREIAQLVKEAGSLHEAIGREEDAAGKARAEATGSAEAARTTSPDGLRLVRPEGEDD